MSSELTMKTLLVNCSLKTKGEPLQEALREFSECSVVDFTDVYAGYQVEAEVDAVVISGSAARIVQPSDRAKFLGVTQLVKTCKQPILGICFGHQLLCWVFGAEVGSLPQPVDRFEKIRIVEADQIFDGLTPQQTVPLAESHFDYVLKESLDNAGFMLLADSASCEVEAVKHRSKPFYGTQFHPERVTLRGETHPEGHKVIENFYRNVVKR